MSSLLGPTLLSEAPRASGQTWPRYCSWPAAITPNGSAMRQVLPPSAVPRPWRRRREMTIRHRLNRAGNCQANHALWRIATVRLSCDPATQAYAKRRRSEGKSDREIVRCLKPLCRPVRFTSLLTQPPRVPNGAELRAVRVAHGLSLAVVAKSLGTFGSYTSKLERGLVHDSDFADRYERQLSDFSAELAPGAPPQRPPKSANSLFSTGGLDSYRSFTAPSKYMAAASPRESGGGPVLCQPTDALAPTGPGSGAARVRSSLNVLYGEVGLKESTFHRSGGPDARAARTEPI